MRYLLADGTIRPGVLVLPLAMPGVSAAQTSEPRRRRQRRNGGRACRGARPRCASRRRRLQRRAAATPAAPRQRAPASEREARPIGATIAASARRPVDAHGRSRARPARGRAKGRPVSAPRCRADRCRGRRGRHAVVVPVYYGSYWPWGFGGLGFGSYYGSYYGGFYDPFYRGYGYRYGGYGGTDTRSPSYDYPARRRASAEGQAARRPGVRRRLLRRRRRRLRRRRSSGCTSSRDRIGSKSGAWIRDRSRSTSRSGSTRRRTFEGELSGSVSSRSVDRLKSCGASTFRDAIAL